MKVRCEDGNIYEVDNSEIKYLHRLLCGDSTSIDDVNKLMNGEKADMVFTDPPYGMFLDTDFTDIAEMTKGNKHTKVIGDNEDFTPELINTIFACFSYCKEIFLWGADYYAELLTDKNKGSWIVWDKTGGKDIGFSLSEFELCWSKQKHHRKVIRDEWRGIVGLGKEDTKNRIHPTQKPVSLINIFMKEWGKDAKIIVDIFGGSGSTMVACHQLNRKCYMSELDPKYVQTIINRMIKLDPTLEIKRNGVPYTKSDFTE